MSAAAIRIEQPAELGAQIIAAGFAANDYHLDINGALDVPRGFELSAPWNLPSRLFQFPIEVIRAEQDEPRKIGLRHRHTRMSECRPRPCVASPPATRKARALAHSAPWRTARASIARYWQPGPWRDGIAIGPGISVADNAALGLCPGAPK